MKVKVKIDDFNEACVEDNNYNGYVEVKAEPIEEKEEPEYVCTGYHPVGNLCSWCGIKKTREEAFQKCIEIVKIVFEKNWVVQDTLDALEKLKGGEIKVKVKVKIADLKRVATIQEQMSGYLVVEAEPIEEPEWVNKIYQLWCKPEHENKVMDVDFAQSIKELFKKLLHKFAEEIYGGKGEIIKGVLNRGEMYFPVDGLKNRIAGIKKKWNIE